MTKPQHTPGPWKIVCNESSLRVQGDNDIVTVVRDRNSSSIPDAHLIAAAPDMLNACKIIQNNLKELLADYGADVEDWAAEDRLAFKACLDAATAAINKAEGKS